ncbi:recombination protein O N-terminal domain-containing protein [Candidatus Xiphinematobacter sp. Idaho Grape]|uniref:recombination protein O N-terminal domain-containing protein n=1 Tax=Candidatus Xiphinematobacter sp. Idaho Grape TaxID=1704307 RepID=UPI00130D88B3
MERTAAILIRKTPFSETTLLCTWISERCGRIKTSAHGARNFRSPFQGSLELFYEVEICFKRSRKSDLYSLREARALLPFMAGNLSYFNFVLAAYFSELAEAVLPVLDESAPEVFDLLRRGLRYLRKSPASLCALTKFESNLCQRIGIGGNPLEALEHYCGCLPRSRATAFRVLSRAERYSPAR